MSQVKFGALCWNQYTDWPSLLEAGIRADRLGFDTLWTWDHLYPIVGDSKGPIYEGWLVLTAWAQATQRVRLGLMVGANTFREPTLVAKMATTLDHISSGRAILGIGAAWFADGARGLRAAVRDGPPERLRWLGEALPILRGMLDGTAPSATGPRYGGRSTRNLPAPIQPHLPILVGGGGARVTLKLVARYADANNVGGGIDERPAQGGDPARALRDGRPRPARDRAHHVHRHRLHPRRPGRGRSGCSGPRSSATRSPTCGPTSRSGRPRTSPSAWRPTSSSATATSSPVCPRPTTRSR